MKEHLWGLIGTIIATFTFVIQCVKEFNSAKRERIEKQQEQQEKLLLKLCDQIEYYNGLYRIKFINTSLVSIAYNLNVSIRIKNNHFNYTYQIPDFSAKNAIYSINQERDVASCEIFTHINVMDIAEKEIKKHASLEILTLYASKQLELRHILEDRDCYLAIKYNAVNRSNGNTIEFTQQNFNYDSIVHGIFGIGHDFVTPISND